MNKLCSKCGTYKPSEEFHKSSRAVDGLASHCKECNLAYHKASQQRPEVRKRKAEAHLKDYYNHPERHAARNILHYAIKRGEVVRQPCEKCGDPDSHAHHDDYSKPLQVRWLCSKDHGLEHASV